MPWSGSYQTAGGRGDLQLLVMRHEMQGFGNVLLTWDVVASPLPWLLELKVDTDKNKEDDENESCSTVNHDGIL